MISGCSVLILLVFWPHMVANQNTTLSDCLCVEGCITSCTNIPNGDYHSCQGCNVFATCSEGMLFDNRPCPASLVWDDNLKRCEFVSPTCATAYTSCMDVEAKLGNPSNGTYLLVNECFESFEVYCEFLPNHIYTYIAPTNISVLNVDTLTNNHQEVLLRHQLSNWHQLEAKIEQINDYNARNLFLQYDDNSGYANIINSQMGPYLYLGFLPIAGITHLGDTQGYSVNGIDYTFTNCDGNPNSYFALLFNENGANFTSAGEANLFMTRWKDEAVAVAPGNELPDHFFSQFEMHMGGCGGFMTSHVLQDLVGVNIGLRYDYTYSSCAEVHETLTDPESGIFYLKNEEEEAYKVYCDFYPTHIYTYIAPTCLTSLDVSNLYNNQQEVLIRHRLNDGSQLEAKIEQIADYKMQDLSIQYNQNVGYNSIINSQMGPYLYLGFLPIAGITHLGDTQGYSVNGIDYTFTNCDGNPNSYFVILFNKNGANFTSAGGANLFMTRWKNEAVAVAPENELPDHFFSQFEMHMGGCGGFMTSDSLSDLFGVTIGLRYDFTYSSCAEISNTVTNPESGIFFLENDEGAKFKVYCDFYPTHIYTYIAPTCLASLNVSSLYNNQQEVLIRHRLNDGSQLEAKVEQIADYKMQDLSIQYNQNVGYNSIINSQMGPYLYLGFLPIAGITHLGDTQGYSVNGIDYTFTNCDGNPNSYFVLLFNKNGANFTGTGGANLFMTRWKNEAVAIAPENELPDHFFSQFEMHMGGCGGFMTSDVLSDLFGVTIGLRYDFTYSSCAEISNTVTNPESGIFFLENDEGAKFKVYCDFYPTHIYTYIAPTCLASLNVSSLYNNQQEVLIRHRLNDGSQLEAKIEQIADYKMQDLSIQYNQNVGYNNIINSQMGPYLYLGFLPIAGITHLGDTQGYSVNGIDYTFTNCDGNPNSYFVLLFNKNGANFTSAGGANLFMTRWKDEAVAVAPENKLPDHFFSQFEMHMGGCGGFMTSDALSDLFGVAIGLRYDFTYSSCAEVSNTVTNPESGIFFLENDEGAKFKVYCDFYPTHIYTYIAPTCLASLNVSSLYNNQQEVLIRHKLNDESQLEAKIEQIADYKMQDLSIQYNQNVGYNSIINSQMGPYLYLGFLPIAGITHLGDTQGYSVNGIDYTFTNCDGNPNSYFVLLFNKNGANFTSAGGANLFMTRWKNEAVAVAPENELPDHFFSQFEMHMGGCGGFMTSDALSDLFGVTIGLRYDFTYSSCAEISNTVTNPESGIFFLENDEGAKFKVYCDFYPTHIYTYIAPTCLASLNVSSLYNNQQEVLIRHRLDDGSQLEAKIEQIADYELQDLSIQYNQNVGYNNIINSQMGPYLYLGFLPIAGITHLGDTQGYSVNGIDYTFTNCDGNPNSYFVLLFNKNGANFTSAGGANLFMTRWKDEAVAVAPENELPDHFFSQFEMHMGGCGGFMTSDALSDLFGVTIGLRFDM